MKMDVKAFFGANLKFYRKEKHLSQEQLSENLSISVKHLSKIERGLTFVSADLLERLSSNLNVSAAALFCKNTERIYDENVLSVFDRITERRLIMAMEGIKGDIRELSKISVFGTTAPNSEEN
jgi:transcriptional regulator with XRE-family HTH domain